MWKERVVELMSFKTSEVRVGVKVNETLSGLHSSHEIMIQQIQIDRKTKYEEQPIKEVNDEDGITTKYAASSYFIVKGVKTSHSETIRLSAIYRMEDWNRCAGICKEKAKIMYKLKS